MSAHGANARSTVAAVAERLSRAEHCAFDRTHSDRGFGPKRARKLCVANRALALCDQVVANESIGSPL
jgi:hypothetical protein